MHPYRTHHCAALRSSDIGQKARLSGWVHRIRDHGGLLFIDLRDHYGLTQCVADPQGPCFAQAQRLRPESVIRLDGAVAARPADTLNPNIPTGQVELRIEDITLLSQAAALPLPVFGEPDYPEDLRLAWRFLDLRRETMHRRIVRRSEIIAALRRLMHAAGFLEFQTPILTASSPEGARDFLVPSRLHPGAFYALPQAPQLFKQLAMISGFDRYFQIAPCFRDEDARADRSPGEFYQLDIEMNFATQEDVLAAVEPILHGLFDQFKGGKSLAPMPFPRLSWAQAMRDYGTDKPDLRNPLVIREVGGQFAAEGAGLRAFREIVEKGGVVRAIPAPGAAARPRSFFDRLNEWARREMRAPGLGYIIFQQEDERLAAKGPIAKFLSPEIHAALAGQCGVGAGDALFFAAGPEKQAAALAAAARNELGRALGLIDQNHFAFCWIVDMPLYEWSEEERKIVFSHNPFSMPQGGLDALEARDPLGILAHQYDIVCNGVELSSGAIRAHDPEILFRSFGIAGYGRDEVEARFGALLRALRCGAPPHGGIAPGLDRIVMLLTGAANLRDVVMFPMNQQAQDLLMGAPAPADPSRLRELHIRPAPPPDAQNKQTKAK